MGFCIESVVDIFVDHLSVLFREKFGKSDRTFGVFGNRRNSRDCDLNLHLNHRTGKTTKNQRQTGQI